MAIASSTTSGFSKLQAASQVLTSSGAVKGDVRVVMLNSATAITATWSNAPGDAGEVWFIANVSTAAAGIHTLMAAAGVTWDGTNQSLTLQPGEEIIVVSASTDQYLVFHLGTDRTIVTGASATVGAPLGAIGSLVIARTGAACAITLSAPVAGADDGKLLFVTAGTAQAHTVTVSGGFNDGGSGADVATFGGAIGDSVILQAYNGEWNVHVLRNVTLG